MDDFVYFVEKFIKRERRDRWLGFAAGKWEKFAGKLGELERSLNERCTLVEANAFDVAEKLIVDRKIEKGTYIDYFNKCVLMSPLDLDNVSDDSLLICRDKKIAFYFHHEGWIWICREV
ncbi:MAG TPA: hypothetical protein VNE00_15150 [Paraburkholderia sp.]|jgi:hypothetical protein|nr:hypothetical protein [Paraburkholderia sp.]